MRDAGSFAEEEGARELLVEYVDEQVSERCSPEIAFCSGRDPGGHIRSSYHEGRTFRTPWAISPCVVRAWLLGGCRAELPTHPTFLAAFSLLPSGEGRC